jgi:NhaP-type Na+/H+ or K+/H+ antiporter
MYLLVGLGLMAAVQIDRLCERRPVSLPIVYTAIGFVLFSLPLGLPPLVPLADEAHAKLLEYTAEFIVLVSLMGAGVTITRRPKERSFWRPVWLLLAVTFPLTVGVVALLGWAWLGLPVATALLLGACLAPTDPVLAESVQMGPPGSGDDGRVRFALTVEAGLNDGLAFPFTYLALAALSTGPVMSWLPQWAAVDLLWQTLAGIGVGYAVGRLGAWYVFEFTPESDELSTDGPITTSEGLVVIGTILCAYCLAELVEGYGFLAVFVAAVAARQHEDDSRYHVVAHHFVREVERIVLVVMLLGFGALLAGGVLDALTWPGALLAAGLVLVARPLLGWLALQPAGLAPRSRVVTSFMGVRGMGTLYYLAYAYNHGTFGRVEEAWAIAAFTVVLSIVVHGATAGWWMLWMGDGSQEERVSATPEASVAR